MLKEFKPALNTAESVTDSCLMPPEFHTGRDTKGGEMNASATRRARPITSPPIAPALAHVAALTPHHRWRAARYTAAHLQAG